MADHLHEIKIEMNHVEHDAICAHQVLEQRLKEFEAAGAWTTEDLTTKFRKWQAMHRGSVWKVFEDQFMALEQRLTGMEKAVGELKGLQTQMAEFL